MRKTPEDFSKFFNGYSIEIKFIGVQGSILEDDMDQNSMIDDGLREDSSLSMLKSLQIKTKNDEWLDVQGKLRVKEDCLSLHVVNN